jgi:ABC-2 type transport system ATP-binding protein
MSLDGRDHERGSSAVNAPAIACSGLSKRYGHVVALDSLELEVPRGSIFGFLGPNGAGKTTAMRLLLGLSTPTDGEATVLGHDIRTASLEVRRRVGYLAQLPRFYDELTPRETLRFALGFFPRDRDERIDDDITEAIELVGLAAKADEPVGSLSGGQRQRLGVAQAYVHRPELLILDEPAAALDPIGRRDVLDIMRRLRGSTTIFYSTHILDDVQRVSDTVAVLHEGRRVAQAPIEELLTGSDDVAFDVRLRGDVDAAVARLNLRPWVSRTQLDVAGEATRLRVEVSDPSRAERELLRLLLEGDRDLVVTDFTRHRFELEDVFVELVEGGRR